MVTPTPNNNKASPCSFIAIRAGWPAFSPTIPTNTAKPKLCKKFAAPVFTAPILGCWVLKNPNTNPDTKHPKPEPKETAVPSILKLMQSNSHQH